MNGASIAVFFIIFQVIDCQTDCRPCKGFRCSMSPFYCYDGCNDGYYPDRTGLQCLACPENCITCVSSSNCTQCSEGRYGWRCLGDCLSSCVDGICDQEFCTHGCAYGYYNVSSLCHKCRSSCKSCTDYETCQECSQGFILDRNTSKCNNCPKNCVNCTSMTSCPVCKDSWFGEVCELTKDPEYCTDENCEVCRYESNSWFPSCAQCKEGRNCKDDQANDDKNGASDGVKSSAYITLAIFLFGLVQTA